MIKQLFCVIGLLVLAMTSYAQNSIYVKGASHQGQVRLRWAPASIGSFQKGNQHGYRVVRQLLARNGTPVSAQEQSSSTTVFGPFKPLPDAQWDPIADTSENPFSDGQGNNIVRNIIKSDILPNASISEIDALIEDGIKLGKDDFWVQYNAPFLEAAFARGDDIRLCSDRQIFLNEDSFFGRELRLIENPDPSVGLLKKYNYQYNSNTFTYEKL